MDGLGLYCLEIEKKEILFTHLMCFPIHHEKVLLRHVRSYQLCKSYYTHQKTIYLTLIYVSISMIYYIQ